MESQQHKNGCYQPNENDRLLNKESSEEILSKIAFNDIFTKFSQKPIDCFASLGSMLWEDYRDANGNKVKVNSFKGGKIVFQADENSLNKIKNNKRLIALMKEFKNLFAKIYSSSIKINPLSILKEGKYNKDVFILYFLGVLINKVLLKYKANNILFIKDVNGKKINIKFILFDDISHHIDFAVCKNVIKKIFIEKPACFWGDSTYSLNKKYLDGLFEKEILNIKQKGDGSIENHSEYEVPESNQFKRDNNKQNFKIINFKQIQIEIPRRKCLANNQGGEQNQQNLSGSKGDDSSFGGGEIFNKKPKLLPDFKSDSKILQLDEKNIAAQFRGIKESYLKRTKPQKNIYGEDIKYEQQGVSKEPKKLSDFTDEKEKFQGGDSEKDDNDLRKKQTRSYQNVTFQERDFLSELSFAMMFYIYSGIGVFFQISDRYGKLLENKDAIIDYILKKIKLQEMFINNHKEKYDEILTEIKNELEKYDFTNIINNLRNVKKDLNVLFQNDFNNDSLIQLEKDFRTLVENLKKTLDGLINQDRTNRDVCRMLRSKLNLNFKDIPYAKERMELFKKNRESIRANLDQILAFLNGNLKVRNCSFAESDQWNSILDKMKKFTDLSIEEICDLSSLTYLNDYISQFNKDDNSDDSSHKLSPRGNNNNPGFFEKVNQLKQNNPNFGSNLNQQQIAQQSSHHSQSSPQQLNQNHNPVVSQIQHTDNQRGNLLAMIKLAPSIAYNFEKYTDYNGTLGNLYNNKSVDDIIQEYRENRNSEDFSIHIMIARMIIELMLNTKTFTKEEIDVVRKVMNGWENGGIRNLGVREATSILEFNKKYSNSFNEIYKISRDCYYVGGDNTAKLFMNRNKFDEIMNTPQQLNQNQSPVVLQMQQSQIIFQQPEKQHVQQKVPSGSGSSDSYLSLFYEIQNKQGFGKQQSEISPQQQVDQNAQHQQTQKLKQQNNILPKCFVSTRTSIKYNFDRISSYSYETNLSTEYNLKKDELLRCYQSGNQYYNFAKEILIAFFIIEQFLLKEYDFSEGDDKEVLKIINNLLSSINHRDDKRMVYSDADKILAFNIKNAKNFKEKYKIYINRYFIGDQEYRFEEIHQIDKKKLTE
ncbi:MAG: hypothetical protein N4A49_09280 [Marinifilaceae bacterium]|jgi:hypothetical protein|nr:hypothetical protein [Marinifilaceae bacterium]